MRCNVYVPKAEVTNNPAVTNATMVEVDVNSLNELFTKLELEGPLGVRVVAFDQSGTTHYILGQHGWERKLRVLVS